MSFYQSNVTWQSPTGEWNVGFHLVAEWQQDDPDFDWEDEWNVEYDLTCFEATYTAPTEAQVRECASNVNRPNPGTTDYVRSDDVERVAQLEEMKRECRESGRTSWMW